MKTSIQGNQCLKMRFRRTSLHNERKLRMQTPEMFLGLTATGWTAIGSIAGALSILILSIYNYTFLRVAVRGIGAQVSGVQVQLKSMEFQVRGIVFSGCPVLTLRKDQEGDFSIYNCGQGPALMAQ
jgi:hypothetical protein